MKQKTMMKKVLSGMLALVLLLQPMNFHAQEKRIVSGADSVKDEDFVVCYYKGYPITKNQIGENNIINKDVIDMIEQQNVQISLEKKENNISACAAIEETMLDGGGGTGNKVTKSVVIPNRYNEAVVEVSLTSVRFSQTTTSMYFTKDNANKFANGIVLSKEAVIIEMLAGLVPYVGAIISVVCTMDSLRRSSVAEEIREYTDAGYKVRVDMIRTSGYGTYYVVDKWTTKSVQYTTFSDGVTTQKLVGISFK